MATQNIDMFKTQIHRPHFARTFFLLNKPCIPSHSCPSFSIRPRPQPQKKYRNVRVGYVPNNIKAVAWGTNTSISVKATVTVKLAIGGFLCNLVGLSHGPHDISDLFRKSLLLELVSAAVDPERGLEKKPISGYARRRGQKNGEVIYESEFVIPGDFGEIGAVRVENEHQNEMYIKYIVLHGLPNGTIEFNCGSWVQPKFFKPEKRVFFTNKPQEDSRFRNSLSSPFSSPIFIALSTHCRRSLSTHHHSLRSAITQISPALLPAARFAVGED